MERIDKLIKMPIKLEYTEINGYPEWHIIDSLGTKHGSIYDETVALAICTLINGQSVDGIADIYKRDYTGVATNLDGISESVCKSEKCDAPNCYEGHEPKGCLMEGAHKPVVDVQRMAEDDLDKLFERYESETGASVFATNFFKGWLKKNLHGSTLSQSWVSVEDRLPPQKSKHEIVSENVLVCRMNDPMAYTHYYHHGNKKWYGYGQSQCTYDVTHWMPMPTSPLNS